MGKPLVATSSNLVGGVLLFSSFIEAARHSLSDVKHEQHTKLFTGMAQRQRARLITLRTPDRNGLPVLLIISHRCMKALAQSGSVTINRVGMDSSEVFEKFYVSSFDRNYYVCIIHF